MKGTRPSRASARRAAGLMPSVLAISLVLSQRLAGLRGLWVSGQRPLVFAGRGGLARQQVDRGFGEAGALYVLDRAQLPDAPGVSVLGRVAGEWLHHLELSDPGAREALRQLGLEPQAAPIVSLVGPPAFGLRGEERFGEDDLVGLVVARGAVTVTQGAGQEVTLPPGCYRLDRQALSAAARRSGDPPERSIHLEIGRGDPEPPTPAITPAGSRAPSLEALKARMLGLVVRRPVGALGLRLRLSLLADGAPPRRAWTVALGPLPAAVAPDDPAWAWLAQGVPAGERLRLRAELPGLAAVEWPLSAEPDAGDIEPEAREADGAVARPDAPVADPSEPARAEDGADDVDPPFEALPAPRSFVWRLDGLEVAIPGGQVGESVALIGVQDGIFGPRALVLAPRAVGLDALRARSTPQVPRRGPAVLEGLHHLWRWTRAEASGGAVLARAEAARAWERALVLATGGAAWAEAEAAVLDAVPDRAAAEVQVAEALLAPDVAWPEAEPPPSFSRPRAVRELSRALLAVPASARAPEGAGLARLLEALGRWLEDALVLAGAPRDQVDPPASEGPTVAALAPLWRRARRRTVPAPLLALILPQSLGAALERCLTEPPTLAAAASAVEAVAGGAPWGEPWSAAELALLARLWLVERPPEWGPAERQQVAAVVERAAVDQRGARLSRLLALVAGGRLGAGGAP
jgi:hypothetical protein